MYLYIFSVIIIVAILLLFILSGNSYKDFIKKYEADFQLTFMFPASLYLMDKFKIMERISNRLVSVHQNIAAVYNENYAPQYTKMFVAQLISTNLIILVGGAIFFLIGDGDSLILLLAVFVSIIAPMFSAKKLAEKNEERKEEIIYELPELASKVALLVNAGETVQNSIIQSSKMKEEDPNRLYIELAKAVTDLENGQSFAVVMEEFSKRCGAQEASMFTTTILLNYRRGGSELSLSLRELSRELWEKRKTISKVRGEKAASKLIFPMVFIFIAVLIIIAYPALRILG